MTHVLVTFTDGTRRVWPLADYCMIPSAALEGTTARLVGRVEAVRERARP